MINPSEKEVEVDHSFFDSDRGSDSENEEKGEKVVKVEEKGQSQAVSEGFSAKTSESRHGDKPPRTNDTRKEKSHTKSSRTKRSRNRRDRVSSAPTALSESVSSSDCENDTNLNNKRPTDVIQILSTTSSGSDADSKSSSLKSPRLPKTSEVSSYPELKSTERGSLEPERLQTSLTDGSDDSVTDVSPLSSPDSSRSLCLEHTQTEAVYHDEYQEESLPSSGLSNIQQDQDVDECSSFSLQSEFQSKVVVHCPRTRTRKNYSFTNDEVRRIDRENHRLLHQLSHHSPGMRPENAPRRKTPVASASPIVQSSHSAINRTREQQRIEKENLALYKKLHSTKATPGLKRSQQLADYQRHVEPLGSPSYSLIRSRVDKGPPSRIMSPGLRSVSLSLPSTSPQTTKTRPDWCS